jgi:RNA polymerase sigma factor (sigma-70 family)
MSYPDKELETLISGAAKGDRPCQKQIYERFRRKMLLACMRYATDSSSAQDMMHDGFIKVFEKLNDYNFNGSFEGWMRRIMVNNAIDSIRKAKKETIIEADNLIYDKAEFDEEEESLYDVLNLKPQDVMEAVQRLSPAYKMVFNLYVVENYSHKEIAETLNISEGASKSNLAKAKKNLRVYLSEKINKIRL